MATINSYTNIEQSRKLAEILPLESADMKWFFWKEEIDAPKPPTFGYSKTAAECYKDTEAVYLPCWSLAALLGVLPKEIEIDGQHYAPCLFPVQDKWLLKLWHNSNNTITSPISIFSDNAIDACYEMIQKLNEQNLL